MKEKSSSQYKSLLENAGNTIIVIQENKIEFVNQHGLVDLGYSMDDVRDKSIFDYICADDREKVNEYQINQAQKEFPDDLIFRILSKKGGSFFVKTISVNTVWEGRPARMVCIKNIAAKKLNELTAKNSEHLLYSIIDNLPDPTFVIDDHGNVFLWNKALETISGINSKDMIGKGSFENAVPFKGYRAPVLINLILNPDKKIEKEHDYFQRSEKVLIAGRFLVSKNDKDFLAWATSSILYDENWRVIGAVESFREMTEKRSFERIKDVKSF